MNKVIIGILIGILISNIQVVTEQDDACDIFCSTNIGGSR